MLSGHMVKGKEYTVQVFKPFKKLKHIAFYLGFSEIHCWVLQQPRKIMLHIGSYHVHAWFFASIPCTKLVFSPLLGEVDRKTFASFHSHLL